MPTEDSRRAQLVEALTRLTQSRAREARLCVSAGPVYLLWIARRDAATLEQESIASVALPPQYKLSSERGQLMRDLGFGKRGGRRNWRREHGRDRASLARTAEETLDILARIYGVDDPIRAELVEDDTEHPENPVLIAAMRKVAKDRDEAVRRAMYTEMLNATFLVPITEGEAEGAEAFFDFETHASGRPTLGVFTDWASLRLWEPRGFAYWPVHGSSLFEMAMEREPVTMRINPEGDVGGELYAHEVEMLVRAVQSFRRRGN
ncbi:MAG: SseB family protein [Enhygromyxa sp.]